MAKSVRRLLNLHRKLVEDVVAVGEQIGKAVCEALRPFIPDIEFQIGGYDVGVEVITFRSESSLQRSLEYHSAEDGAGYVPVSFLLWEVQEELGIDEVPLDIWCYVHKDVAPQVKEVLRQLLSDVGEEVWQVTWDVLENAVAMFPANMFRLSKHESGREAILYYGGEAVVNWKEKEDTLIGEPTSTAGIDFSFRITRESNLKEVTLQLMSLAVHMELRRAYPRLFIQTELSHNLGGTTYIYQDGVLISSIAVTPDWRLRVTSGDDCWELPVSPSILHKVAEIVVNVVPID